MQRLWLILRTLLAMARHKPWEPVLIILAIIVASSGLTAVQLINEGARQGDIASKTPPLFAGGSISARSEMQSSSSHGGTATPISVTGAPTASLSRDDYVLIRTQGFTQFVAAVEDPQPLSCHSSGSPLNNELTLVALDFMAAANGSAAAIPVSQGRSDNDESLRTMASPGTIATLACSGRLSNSHGQVLAPPTSVAGLPDNMLLMDIRDFYTGSRHPDTHPLTRLIALSALSEQSQQQLKAILPAHLVYTPANTLLEKGTLSESFRLNLWAMGVLMAVVALFIVLNALLLMYRARLPAIIRLRQLGAGSQLLWLAMLIELGVYCVMATPIGVILGVIATRELSPILQQTLANLFDSAFVSPSPALLEITGSTFLTSFAALALFAIFPARQLSQALSRSLVTKTPIPTTRRAAYSLLICAVALFAIVITDSALMALVGVALVLLGGAALIVLWLPALTKILTHLVPSKRPLLGYIVANTHILSGKSRLAVCAFFIALSANIGMNVMTDSFREATFSWLSQRLAAPAYLYTDATRPPEKMPAGVTYQHVYRGFSQLGQQPVTIRSYPAGPPARQHLQLSHKLKNPAQAWHAFASKKAVFINQQLAFRHHLNVGEAFSPGAIFAGNGQARQALWSDGQQFEVAGIYPDYGNPDSQFLLPVSHFQPPEGYAGVTALYSGHQSQLDELKHIGTVYQSEQLLALSMATFDRTFIITNALNIATLLVAGLAFAVSVSVLTLDIKPQLSVLRSFGVRQWQIKGALWGQYFLLCLFTACMALPFGIALAWLFINQVNRYAFYWLYPLHIDTHTLFASLGLSLLVVLVILLLPVGRVKAKVDLRQEEAV